MKDAYEAAKQCGEGDNFALAFAASKGSKNFSWAKMFKDSLVKQEVESEQVKQMYMTRSLSKAHIF